MKSQKLNTELEVINKLLDVVNSKEEFQTLLKEREEILSLFSAQQSMKGGAQKMVMLNKETGPKLKTPAQECLIYKLLQSKVILRKEFEQFYQKIQIQVITSFDASLVISHLLAMIRFRKTFFSKKRRTHAVCSMCRSRENLVRYAVLPGLKQVYYCNACEMDLESDAQVLHPSEISNVSN